MSATTPELKDYTVTYTVNEVQDAIIHAWADRIGSTPEMAFQLIMKMGANFDIQEKLEIIKAQLNKEA